MESRVFQQVQIELRTDKAALLVQAFRQFQLGGNRFYGEQDLLHTMSLRDFNKCKTIPRISPTAAGSENLGYFWAGGHPPATYENSLHRFEPPVTVTE